MRNIHDAIRLCDAKRPGKGGEDLRTGQHVRQRVVLIRSGLQVEEERARNMGRREIGHAVVPVQMPAGIQKAQVRIGQGGQKFSGLYEGGQARHDPA
jgi:hypothetical protein